VKCRFSLLGTVAFSLSLSPYLRHSGIGHVVPTYHKNLKTNNYHYTSDTLLPDSSFLCLLDSLTEVTLLSEIYINLSMMQLDITYLRSWALLEELPIVQPLKNSPEFYGTRRFNTVFTIALNWSLSWAISIQSTPTHPISLRSILMLFTHLRLGLPSGLWPVMFAMSTAVRKLKDYT
jgi:hypothetical protein